MRALVLALFITLLPAAALAQEGAPGTATTAAPAAAPDQPKKKELPPGFQPVPGGEARAESVDANLLVVLAYATFFLAMFGFVIHVVRTQSSMAREISELSRKLETRR